MRTIDPKMALGNLYWGNAYAAQYKQRDPREDHLTLNNIKSLTYYLMTMFLIGSNPEPSRKINFVLL